MEPVESPDDIKRLVLSILEDILENKKVIPQAGTVVQLLNVWLRCHEVQKAEEFEERLTTLEQGFQDINKGVGGT